MPNLPHNGASLSFYVDGDADIAGQGIVNYTYLPSAVMIYGTESAEKSRSLATGTSMFYGVVHAPTADVTIAGQGDLYGAAIGKTLTTNGNGAIHDDECLGKGNNQGGDPFRVVYWRLE